MHLVFTSHLYIHVQCTLQYEAHTDLRVESSVAQEELVMLSSCLWQEGRRAGGMGERKRERGMGDEEGEGTYQVR